jgi:hypothetical protein
LGDGNYFLIILGQFLPKKTYCDKIEINKKINIIGIFSTQEDTTKCGAHQNSTPTRNPVA